MEHSDDNDMKFITEDVAEFIQKASYQYDPMQISTCMLAQALSLAKTYLEPKDFNIFCEYVFKNTHRVKKFESYED